MKSLQFLFLLFCICIFTACDQSPTIEGRWVFDRVDSGDLLPAKTYEFLSGQLLQGFTVKCFNDLQPVGEYSFDGSSLRVKSELGVSMSLVAISDNEAIFDISDSDGANGRVVYNRP